MEAWLKGGLIGGVIGLIVSLILQGCISLLFCAEGASCGNATACIGQSIFYSIIIFIIVSLLLIIILKLGRKKK